MFAWWAGVATLILFISLVGHTYQGWRARVIYMEGIYMGGGTEAICDLLNSFVTERGECLLGGYYNGKLEFKEYRHHFKCSWGDLDVGATYLRLKVMELPIIWLFDCEHIDVTKIDEPYTIFQIQDNATKRIKEAK